MEKDYSGGLMFENRYKKLTKLLKACRIQEDFILEEMDDCWYKMSEEEQNRFRLDNIFCTKKEEDMYTEDVDILEPELKREVKNKDIEKLFEEIYKNLDNMSGTIEEMEKHTKNK